MLWYKGSAPPFGGGIPLCLMLGLDVQPRSEGNDERLQAEGSQFLVNVASNMSLDDLSTQTASRKAEQDAPVSADAPLSAD
jgi:hypothetical protein